MDKNIDIRDMANKNPAQLVIMNFSGVYEAESFYKEGQGEWIDLRHLQGTNCYCDQEAEEGIRRALQGIGPEGVHFLDSGNYHYASKFWLEKIEEEFELLVFDHHTDMQPPMFGDILSCGGWCKAALDGLPLLKRVYLAGPSQDDAVKLDSLGYGERVKWIGEKQLLDIHTFMEWLGITGRALYVSVDKDVLGTDYARTNWDQGTMTIETLASCVEAAAAMREIIGMDVCGENPEEYGACDLSGRLEGEMAPDSDAAVNDKVNELLAGLGRKSLRRSRG